MFVKKTGENKIYAATIENGLGNNPGKIHIDFGDGSCDYVFLDNIHAGWKYNLCTPTGEGLGGTIADLPWISQTKRANINISNEQALAEVINAMPKPVGNSDIYYKLIAAEYRGEFKMPTVQRMGSLHNFCQYYKNDTISIKLDSGKTVGFIPDRTNTNEEFTRKDILDYVISKNVWADSMGEYMNKITESVKLGYMQKQSQQSQKTEQKKNMYEVVRNRMFGRTAVRNAPTQRSSFTQNFS